MSEKWLPKEELTPLPFSVDCLTHGVNLYAYNPFATYSGNIVAAQSRIEDHMRDEANECYIVQITEGKQIPFTGKLQLSYGTTTTTSKK